MANEKLPEIHVDDTPDDKIVTDPKRTPEEREQARQRTIAAQHAAEAARK